MSISTKQVEHIAGLARIRLTEKEKEKFAAELDSILSYVDKLGQVNTESVEPTAQVTGLENIFREDKPTAGEPKREKLIDQFPEHKDDYLKVKPVFQNRY